jgi:hypothetical protein
MSSRANGIETGRSADLTNAEHVAQVAEILRSESDRHIGQDNTAVACFAVERITTNTYRLRRRLPRAQQYQQ